jgi:hypothetical protein
MFSGLRLRIRRESSSEVNGRISLRGFGRTCARIHDFRLLTGRLLSVLLETTTPPDVPNESSPRGPGSRLKGGAWEWNKSSRFGADRIPGRREGCEPLADRLARLPCRSGHPFGAIGTTAGPAKIRKLEVRSVISLSRKHLLIRGRRYRAQSVPAVRRILSGCCKISGP